MGVTGELIDGKRRISFDGKVTVEHVAELKKTLDDALNTQEDIELLFSSVSDVDLAGLQLLCSFHRTVVGAHKKISRKGSMPDVMQKGVAEAGFDRLSGCRRDDQDSCLWTTPRKA